jgi:hypothetical protein
VGILIVSALVVIVPPKDNARPVQFTVLPTVIPEVSMTVPINVVLAPSVAAAVGVQKTSHADAPPASVIIDPESDVSAPSGLKIYVPLPFNVIEPPTSIAPELQYTPGA